MGNEKNVALTSLCQQLPARQNGANSFLLMLVGLVLKRTVLYQNKQD